MRLIDADYLLGTFQAVCSAVSCEECRAKYKNGTCKLEHWLKAQPTIEERKKGEWIGEPIAGYCTVRCSVCKDVFRENNGRWNFCPECGADMRNVPDIGNENEKHN